MQTIGERLEEARKKKGISIREAAEATKIRGDYLTKFENNQFDINLTDLYVRGFLRTYALFLKVPADRILNDYAALGRGEARPKQPSREVYGRMDVSIASVEERNDSPAPENSGAPAAATRKSPRVSRGAEAGPAATAIDPALVFKAGKWVAIAALVLLVLWGAKAIFSGGDEAPARNSTGVATNNAGAVQPAAEPSIRLVALDTVRVTVMRKNPDGSEGATLFTGTIGRGQSQVVPKPGPIFIQASAAQNLEIEINGRRWPTGQTGNMKMQLQ